MSTRKAVTLRLELQDYESLVAEAKRMGLLPSTLARIYVRASLEERTHEPGRRRQEGLKALDRLARLTADLPPVDAVQIARESREALEQRWSLA